MSKSSSRQVRRGPFYGWYIVAATFFMAFLSFGSRYSYGLFVSIWEREFDTTVAVISVAASLGLVVNGLSNPFVGWLTDRYGGSRVILWSMLALGASSVAMAAIPNVYFLIGLYGFVISFAGTGVLLVPGTALIATWFRRRRGAAMGAFTSGASAGGMVLVPFLAYMLQLSNWRVTWALLGAMMLTLALPVLWLVLRDDPKEMGLAPDGDAVAGGSGGAQQPRAGPLTVDRWHHSLRSAPMWQLSMAYVVCGVTTTMMSVHFVPFAEDQGISRGTAALAFGVLSTINLAGVLAVGIISDWLKRKDVLAAIYWIRGVGFLLLALLPGSTGMWAFAVVGGMSWLATVPLTSALAAEIYGVKNLGTIAGIITMAHQFGGAVSVLLAGVIFTVYGTYTPVFLTSAVLLGLAGLSSFSVREQAYSARYQVTVVPAAASGGGE